MSLYVHSSYSHVPLLIPLRSVNNTFNDPLRFSHVPFILLIRVAKMDRLGPTRKRQLGPTDRIRPRILARRLVRPDSMKTSPKKCLHRRPDSKTATLLLIFFFSPSSNCSFSLSHMFPSPYSQCTVTLNLHLPLKRGRSETTNLPKTGWAKFGNWKFEILNFWKSKREVGRNRLVSDLPRNPSYSPHFTLKFPITLLLMCPFHP